jgi:transposase
MLGLDGFELLDVQLAEGEWHLTIETVAMAIGCAGCGVPAEPHGRRSVRVRDMPVGGRPVVLAWRKRLWRCAEPACAVRTWTETSTPIRPRAVLTERARAEACRRVGKDAHAVAAVARDLEVGWHTIMRAVRDLGRALVNDPTRLDGVAALGLDETAFLTATPTAPTRYVTGLVDLAHGRLLDVVLDRTSSAVDGWLGNRPADWLAQIAIVALDPWRGYANRALDEVRCRVQHDSLGHRGRKPDPLYRIRKLLVTAAEQLTPRGRTRLRAGLAAGDPTGQVAAAWQAKELLRAVYRAAGPSAARAALERFWRWCDGVHILELSRLARTVRIWQAEILAWHVTNGCSNGPTEAVSCWSSQHP